MRRSSPFFPGGCLSLLLGFGFGLWKGDRVTRLMAWLNRVPSSSASVSWLSWSNATQSRRSLPVLALLWVESVDPTMTSTTSEDDTLLPPQFSMLEFCHISKATLNACAIVSVMCCALRGRWKKSEFH